MELAALIYEYVEGMAERRAPHRDAHLALIDDYLADGRLLIAGALGDPPAGGLLVFAGPRAARSFAEADPYEAAGLITSARVEPWKIVAQRPLSPD